MSGAVRKTIEASDIVGLLKTLGEKDVTCAQLHAYAVRSENILTVCHEAIRALAAEKAHLTRMAVDLASMRPMAPIIISSVGIEPTTDQGQDTGERDA